MLLIFSLINYFNLYEFKRNDISYIKISICTYRDKKHVLYSETFCFM